MGGQRALHGQVGKKTLSGGKGTLRGRKKNRLQARNGRKRSPRRAEKKPFAAGKRSKKNPARAKTCTEWNRAKVKYQHRTGGKEAPDGRKRNPSQPENGRKRTLRGRKPGRNDKAGKKNLAGGGVEPCTSSYPWAENGQEKNPGRRNRGTRLRPIIIYKKNPVRAGAWTNWVRARNGRETSPPQASGKKDPLVRKRNPARAQKEPLTSTERAEKKPQTGGKETLRSRQTV